MSAIAATSLGSPLSASGMPAINPATEPEVVRRGGQPAKTAFQQGLAFEDVLLNELTQQLTNTVSGTGDDGDGLGGSSDSSDDGSSDPAAGAYSSLMPQALSQGIMSAGGGTSIALQIAEGIDPKLALDPTGARTASSSAGAVGP